MDMSVLVALNQLNQPPEGMVMVRDASRSIGRRKLAILPRVSPRWVWSSLMRQGWAGLSSRSVQTTFPGLGAYLMVKHVCWQSQKACDII
jgi:hypothetical protein